jgi:hypothetical protein
VPISDYGRRRIRMKLQPMEDHLQLIDDLKKSLRKLDHDIERSGNQSEIKRLTALKERVSNLFARYTNVYS